jgi:hypothetical protein
VPLSKNLVFVNKRFVVERGFTKIRVLHLCEKQKLHFRLYKAMKIYTSKLLWICFAYNVFQSLILIFKRVDGLNLLVAVSLITPVVFISYMAVRLDKLAYTLQLYWFGVQIPVSQVQGLEFSWVFGIKTKIMLIGDSFGIDLVSLVIFAVMLLESDKVFPEYFVDEQKNPQATIVDQKKSEETKKSIDTTSADQNTQNSNDRV